jgi:hypothetical protein
MCPSVPGSRLPAWGSSGDATCPRGFGSSLPARSSSRTAACRLGSSTHLLAQCSFRAATCPEDGLCRLQAIKQISPGDPAIMISIGACARISSKRLRDKCCSARPQGVQQAAHEMQTRHVVGRSQWLVTVPSGSTTLGYRATATRRQHRGPPVSHRYGPSDATAQHRTNDRMQGGRQQDLACPRC